MNEDADARQADLLQAEQNGANNVDQQEVAANAGGNEDVEVIGMVNGNADHGGNGNGGTEESPSVNGNGFSQEAPTNNLSKYVTGALSGNHTLTKYKIEQNRVW